MYDGYEGTCTQSPQRSGQHEMDGPVTSARTIGHERSRSCLCRRQLQWRMARALGTTAAALSTVPLSLARTKAWLAPLAVRSSCLSCQPLPTTRHLALRRPAPDREIHPCRAFFGPNAEQTTWKLDTERVTVFVYKIAKHRRSVVQTTNFLFFFSKFDRFKSILTNAHLIARLSSASRAHTQA